MHCMQKIKFNVQKCFLYLSAVPFVPWTRGWRVFVEQGCQSLSVQVMRGYFPKNVQSTFVTKYIHYPSKWIRQTKVKTWILWSFSDGEVIFFNLLSVKKCAGVFMWEIFCFLILFLTSSSWLHEAFHCLRHPVLACVTDLKTPDSFSSRWRNILPHQSAYH